MTRGVAISWAIMDFTSIIAISCLLLVCACGVSNAQDAEKCRSISDNPQRLACFDAEFALKPAAASTPPPSPDARYNYAKGIEQQFLGRGDDMSMMSIEAPGKDTVTDKSPAHYPQLIFFGYFRKPFVYQAVAQTKVLEAAQSLGFRTVDFFSRSGEGHWFYDLPSAGPLPRCDRAQRLCH